MTRRVHVAAAMLALTTLVVFWTSTLGAELFGGVATIMLVKRSIALGLLVMVPAMAATALTGESLSKGAIRGVLGTKRTRTRIAAANGVLVLVPCALTLWWLSRDGALGPSFYAVQVLELAAGALNVALLGLNARAGYQLGSARRASSH